MMKTHWLGIILLVAAGCGQAPAPTGPAAEATTPDVEVTMPDASGEQATSDQTSLVSFKVPGMT